MNASLKKALEAAEQLPDAEQESLAAIILQEIEDERGWDERFARSQSQLEELARRADAEVGQNSNVDACVTLARGALA
jgi:hypothetical protein